MLWQSVLVCITIILIVSYLISHLDINWHPWYIRIWIVFRYLVCVVVGIAVTITLFVLFVQHAEIILKSL